MKGRRSVLETLFRIKPEERTTAMLLFIQCFCVVAAAFVVGRTLGVTLFLQRVDPSYVPYTYVLSAGGVSLVALVYTRVADRFRRDRIIQGSALLFAIACVVLRLTLHNSLGFLALVYVFFDVVGDISMIQLWTLASDVTSARQGKRLFAFVGAGGSLGGAAVGALLGSMMHVIGAPNLFYVVAVLLLVGAFAARHLGALHKLKAPAPQTPRAKASRQGLVGDRYAMGLALLLVFATLVATLVDYTWKMSARAAYLGDEEGLASFFAYFAVATNGVAIFVQLFVTSRLLERFGLRGGLSALPGGLLGAVGGAIVATGSTAFFWAANLAKGVDAALRYSINDASILVLYRPIPARLRGQAKAFIGGVVKPVAAAGAGLLIAFLGTGVELSALGYFTAPILVVWLILAAVMRRFYVRRLAEQLATHSHLEGDALTIDAQTRTALAEALSGDDRVRCLGALALLDTFDELPFELPLAKLLCTSDAEVASMTLKVLATHGVVGSVAEVEAAMQHSDAEVQAGAVAVVLRHGGLASLLAAGRHLEGMVAHEDAVVREAAAGAFAQIGDERFYAPLLGLLADTVPKVRVAAAHAAEHVASPALAPALVELLGGAVTRCAATRALIAIGDDAVVALQPHLDAKDEASRVAAARAMGAIGGELAAALLDKRLALSTDAMARECAQVLSRKDSGWDGDAKRVESLLQEEIALAEDLQRTIHEAGNIEPELLGDALRQRWRRSAGHVLALAAMLVRGHDLHRLDDAILSGDALRKGNALELIDNLELGDVGPRLLALFEQRAPAKGRTRGECIVSLLDHDDAWVVACAVYELAIDRKLAPHAERLEAHPHPLVRETFASASSGILVRRVEGASIRMVSPFARQAAHHETPEAKT